MPNEDPKFILFDFDSLVPTFGREDRRGNPESLLIDAECLTMLQKWSEKESPPRLVVFRFLTKERQLRRWVRDSPLGAYFKDDSVFGGDADLKKGFETIAEKLGILNSSEVRAEDVDMISDSTIVMDAAAELGWRSRSDPRSPGADDPRRLDALVRLTVDSGEWESVLSFFSDSAPCGFTPLRFDCLGDEFEVLALMPSSRFGSLKERLDPGDRLLSRGERIQRVDGYKPDYDLVEVAHGDLSEEERNQYQKSLDAYPLVERTRRGFVVGMSSTSPIPIPHPPLAPHGHTVLLVPQEPASFAASDPDPIFGYELTSREISIVDSTTCREFESLHQRLCGLQRLNDGRAIRSRSTGHPEQNRLAARFVANQLRRTLGERHVFQALHRFDSPLLFNVDSRIPGCDAEHEVVILGAHLDSEDKNGGYAPGADDDASGVVAVLLAARRLADLATTSKPRRAIRFVLFNNEENNMVGSKCYVEHLKRESAIDGRSVVAMIQLDMVGWKGEKYAKWKPIAVRGPGRWSPVEEDPLRKRSALVAEAIEAAAAQLSLLHVIEFVNEDRDQLATRSDHSSFYEKGYPACLVVERGVEFADRGSPGSPPIFNPTYHTAHDLEIDYCLATSVAKIVTAAVWKIANS